MRHIFEMLVVIFTIVSCIEISEIDTVQEKILSEKLEMQSFEYESAIMLRNSSSEAENWLVKAKIVKIKKNWDNPLFRCKKQLSEFLKIGKEYISSQKQELKSIEEGHVDEFKANYKLNEKLEMESEARFNKLMNCVN